MKKMIVCAFWLAAMTGFAGTQALQQLVYEIRDPQTSPGNFRRALEKIGEYLALEVLEVLDKQEASIETLTRTRAVHQLSAETPVLVTILRAGLPLNAGVHKVFPDAQVGFLAMSRDEHTLKARVDYIGMPDLRGKSVILSDTMLATGGSIIDALRIIESYGPKQIFVVAAIASAPGISRVLQYNPNIKILAGTVDPLLNDKGYIVPGLGDAGDRLYGEKHALDQPALEHVAIEPPSERHFAPAPSQPSKKGRRTRG